MKNMNSSYHLLILSGVLWGLTPVIYKNALLFTTILALILMRFLGGALIMYLLHRRSFITISLKQLLLAALVGLFTAGALLWYVFGIELTSALHASLISITLPFSLYFIMGVVLKEQIHRRVVVGSAIAATGLVTIVAFTAQGSDAEASLAGDMMMFMSQVFTALSIVTGRKLLTATHKPMPPEQLVFYEYLIAGVIIALIALTGFQTISFDMTLQALAWVLVVVTIAGVVPILLFYRAIENLPGERISDNNFISPLVGFAAAALLLGETITMSFAVGASIIFVGLLISNNKLHPAVIGAHMKMMPKTLLQKIVNATSNTYYSALDSEQAISRHARSLGRQALDSFHHHSR